MSEMKVNQGIPVQQKPVLIRNGGDEDPKPIKVKPDQDSFKGSGLANVNDAFSVMLNARDSDAKPRNYSQFANDAKSKVMLDKPGETVTIDKPGQFIIIPNSKSEKQRKLIFDPSQVVKVEEAGIKVGNKNFLGSIMTIEVPKGSGNYSYVLMTKDASKYKKQEDTIKFATLDSKKTEESNTKGWDKIATKYEKEISESGGEAFLQRVIGAGSITKESSDKGTVEFEGVKIPYKLKPGWKSSSIELTLPDAKKLSFEAENKHNTMEYFIKNGGHAQAQSAIEKSTSNSISGAKVKESSEDGGRVLRYEFILNGIKIKVKRELPTEGGSKPDSSETTMYNGSLQKGLDAIFQINIDEQGRIISTPDMPKLAEILNKIEQDAGIRYGK